MTFNENIELKDLIKCFDYNTKNIKVTYLENEYSYTHPYSDEMLASITETMINQALDRDKRLYEQIKAETRSYFLKTISSCLLTAFFLEKNVQLLFCLSFLIGLMTVTLLTESNDKLEELKKFRLFYSMKDELEKKENKDITKIIEVDSLYREPLNIGTLDNFSYSQVKSIKKELKRRNERRNLG